MPEETPKIRIDQLPGLAAPSVGSLMYIFRDGVLHQIEYGSMGFSRWYIQASVPSGTGRTINDWWINTGAGNTINHWNGSTWETVSISYSSLSGRPSLGSAAGADVNDFATAAQGSKADTALQPGSIPTMPSGIVIVNSVTEFPALSSGFYNLASNTTYLICGTVNIGSNRIRVASGTKILGTSKFVSQIIYSGTASAILAQDVNFEVSDISLLGGGSGTAIESDNENADHGVLIKDCMIQNFNTGLLVNDLGDLRIENNMFDMSAVDRPVLSLTDSFGRISLKNNFLSTRGNVTASAPAIIDTLQVSGNSRLRYNHNNVTIEEQAVFSGNTQLELSGVTPGEPLFIFSGNGGVQDSLTTAEYGFSGNSTGTAIITQEDWVPIAIATSAHNLNRFEHTSPNSIEYVDFPPMLLSFFAEVVVTAESSSTVFEVGVFRNDVLIAESVRSIDCTTEAVPYFGLINSFISVETIEDTFDVRIRNMSNTDNVTVNSLRVVVGA